ncbi:MAG TPA: hypothetical protein VGM50_08890 [Gemmatimonadaceae bacterium]
MADITPQQQFPPTRGSQNSREMRRLMLILVGSIVVLDAAVIGVYYGFHIPERPMKTQESFIAVWVVLTLLLVTTQMKKIRKLRRRST